MPASATAGLFPGQGSHTSGIREHVDQAVPELLDAAVQLVGEDPFPRIAESTRFAQPAIFCASMASWQQLPSGLRPGLLAGHSLGELSALVAARTLDPICGLRLAVLRGELMDACASAADGGMLAVLGCDEDYLAPILLDTGLTVANDNAPGQVVLAGPQDRLDSIAARLRREGQRTMRLDVAGAFHTPLMQPAVEPFRAALEDVDLLPPQVPVISCASARPFRDIRAELAEAIAKPVRWRETMRALTRLGARAFIDFGPGEVLARLVHRNLPAAQVIDPHPPATPTPQEPSGVA
jgi:malonyl CoA-acyl carrier protein transacylase